jgi:predicted O-methyltransferase YrrM
MSKFFKLLTENITINNNKKSDIIQDFKIFEEHNKIYYKIKNSNSNIIKYVKNEKYDIDVSSINDVNYVVSIFGMSDAGILNRVDDDDYPKFMIGDTKNKPILSEKTDMKFKNIMTTELNKKDNLTFAKINNCFERDMFILKINLEKLFHLFKHLELGGNCLMGLNNTGLCSTESIEFIYLYASLFEYIIILEGYLLYGFNFKPKIQKEEIKKLYNKDFMITPKNNLKELLKYETFIFENKIYILNLILNDKEEEYLYNMYNKTTDIILNSHIIDLEHKQNLILKIKKHLINYFKVIFLNTKSVKIHSNIKKQEGDFIDDIIKKFSFKKCLEVGMAFGISALYILQNKNTTLLSIDPFQSTQWKNSGVDIVKNLEFDKRHKLIEDKSYIVLPELLKKKEKYDFIFIDGFHTFDYTLLDFFYADKLLKINGVIIIDDILHNGVKKCVDYINTNYGFYKRIQSPITIGCYKKIKDDEREWNFHKDF